MVHDIITSTQAQTNDRDSLRTKIQQHFEKPSNSDLDTNIDFYQFEKEIGKGSFGKVCLGTHRLTGLKVAIKIFRRVELEACDHTRQKVM
jgi:serine/threonine protein kinase